ncbi:MAG: S10 family serine carboxypeptidase-like protein, partial [Betaproteobacteria bacterium]
MRRTAVTFAVVLLLSSPAASSIAAAQEASDRSAQRSQQPKPAARDGAEAPAERAVVTAHSLQLGARAVAYKATAGTLLIHDDKDKPDASFFYVAYTVDGEPAKRPLTFLYNGGPGSSTIWLHMGSFGPVRVVTSSPEATAPAPYQLVP